MTNFVGHILQQLYSAMIGAGIYYRTWVLKNKNLFGISVWAVNIPLIIALIFTPTLVGKVEGKCISLINVDISCYDSKSNL